MDRLQWTLELVDRLSGPGRSCAAAFEHLTDSQVAAMAAASRLANAEHKSATALKEVTSGVRKLTSEDLELVDATRKARREFAAADDAMAGLKQVSVGMTGSLLQAAVWENLARGIMSAARSVVTFTAKAAFAIGEKFFDTAQWSQDVRSSLAVFAGSKGAGDQEFTAITSAAERLGLRVQETTDAYKGLRAAQFSVTEATDFIKTGADLQTVVGVSDEAIQRFLIATSQIKAKGKTSAEELMQIQEAVNLSQGAIFEKMSEVTGKSIDKVRKLQEQGKISSEVGIKAIQMAALELVGATKAGEATEREVSTTLRGMVRLAKSGADSWLIAIGERLMPAFDSLAQKVMGTFKDFEQSGRLGRFTDAVVVVFERLTSAIEDAWPRVEKLFGRGVDGITDDLLELSRSFDDMLDTVLTLAEFIQNNWTGVKYTFVGVTAVTAGMITAIAGASVINAIRTVSGVVRGLAGAYRTAAAAKAAMAAADSVGPAARIAGQAIPAAGSGGMAMKAAGTAAPGAAAKGLLAGGAGLAAATTAALIGVAAAGWQGYELWRENQDFGLFDVNLILTKLRSDLEAFPQWIAELKDSLGAENWAAGAMILDSMTMGLTSRLEGMAEAVLGIGAHLSGMLEQAGGEVGTVALNVGTGIVDAMTGGMLGRVGSLVSAAASMATSALDGAKAAIGWASPPKRFTELGEGSADAFTSSLASKLPTAISLDLGAKVAPADGWMQELVRGLPPQNDFSSEPHQMQLPIASGDGFSRERMQLPQQTQFNIDRGSNAAGGVPVSIGAIPITVIIEGGGSADAEAIAAAIAEQVPPKVRAELQKVLTNAAGSTT